MRAQTGGYRRWSRYAVAISATCFAVFVAELLIRRFGGTNALGSFDLPPVVEVALLFGTTIAFVIASLLREKVEGPAQIEH
jgi:hypothetical protein